jgi:hypothetical protein
LAPSFSDCGAFASGKKKTAAEQQGSAAVIVIELSIGLMNHHTTSVGDDRIDTNDG